MEQAYDVLVIGMGPAGMAVAAMAAGMGFRVCAVEGHRLGGECMNVGCIPSKALLKMAASRHEVTRLGEFALEELAPPGVRNPFERIQEHLRFIMEKKTLAMFDKVELVVGKGLARFSGAHAIRVGERTLGAKRIFICSGTRPAVPPIPGLDGVDYLTNETVFSLARIPASLIVLGGGAIGCELAQAFSRLGARADIVHMDPHLIPAGDPESGALLEEAFRAEGIGVYNGRRIRQVLRENGLIALVTDRDEKLSAERLLVGAGRTVNLEGLDLERAGVDYNARGITVNRYLQTSQKHIYACGDCNGHALFSHAAMHQGMIALMNCLLPGCTRRDFRKYVVPWTVFTDPQVSHAGVLESELQAKGVRYETVRVAYGDYGAAIAEGVGQGFVKVFVSRSGRILGVRIVGQGSGEMINEWALAIQKGIRIHDIMLLQHSFPSMSFLNKRVAETWMMNRMRSAGLRRMLRRLF